MKYLKLFNDSASYEAWKSSEDSVTPNVVCKRYGGVIYKPADVIKTIFSQYNYEDRKQLYDYLLTLNVQNDFTIELPYTLIIDDYEWNNTTQLPVTQVTYYADNKCFELYGVIKNHDCIGDGSAIMDFEY